MPPFLAYVVPANALLLAELEKRVHSDALLGADRGTTGHHCKDFVAEQVQREVP